MQPVTLALDTDHNGGSGEETIAKKKKRRSKSARMTGNQRKCRRRDLAQGLPPPPTYSCHTCWAIGDHFQERCPSTWDTAASGMRSLDELHPRLRVVQARATHCEVGEVGR